MTREILEDAAIMYRQEAENLVLIAAPAVVLGPILVLVSEAGLKPALVTIPLFFLLYLATYAASVRAASLVLSNVTPDPGRSFLGVLVRAPGIVWSAAPAGLLVGVAWGSALAVREYGFPLPATALALLTAAGAFFWFARHAYELPLMLVHDVGATDAGRMARRIAEDHWSSTLSFVAVVAAPMMAAGLLMPVLAAVVKPSFGGAVFAAAFALWLPFCAICLSLRCDRLVGEAAAEDTRSLPVAS